MVNDACWTASLTVMAVTSCTFCADLPVKKPRWRTGLQVTPHDEPSREGQHIRAPHTAEGNSQLGGKMTTNRKSTLRLR